MIAHWFMRLEKTKRIHLYLQRPNDQIDETSSGILQEGHCHFDGNHKRDKFFVTFTAIVYDRFLKKQVFLLHQLSLRSKQHYS